MGNMNCCSRPLLVVIYKALLVSCLLLVQACGDKELSRSEALKLIQGGPSIEVFGEDEYSSHIYVGAYKNQRDQLKNSVHTFLTSYGEIANEAMKEIGKRSSDSEQYNKLWTIRALLSAGLIEKFEISMGPGYSVLIDTSAMSELCLKPGSRYMGFAKNRCYFKSYDCDATEVTGITGMGDYRTVEFKAHCLPTKPMSSNGFEAADTKRTAKFRLYDDGWRLNTD